MAPDGAASRFKTRFSNLSFLHGFPANAHVVTPLSPPPPLPPLPKPRSNDAAAPLPRSDVAYDVRTHEHVRSVSSGTVEEHTVTRHMSHRAEVVPGVHESYRAEVVATRSHDSYPIDIDEWASPGPSRYPSMTTQPHTLPSPTSFGVRRKPSGARAPPPLNLDAARKVYMRPDRAPIEIHGVEELASPLSPVDVARRVPLHPAHPAAADVAYDARPVHVEDEHAYSHSPAPRVWSALDPDKYRDYTRHSPSPPRDDGSELPPPPPRRPAPPSPLELHDVALTPAPTRPATQFSAAPSKRESGLKALASAAGKRLSRAMPTKAVRFEPPHHRLSSEAGSVLDVRWAEEGNGGKKKGVKEPMTRKQRREAFWRKVSVEQGGLGEEQKQTS